jgi:hypothetical protein
MSCAGRLHLLGGVPAPDVGEGPVFEPGEPGLGQAGWAARMAAISSARPDPRCRTAWPVQVADPERDEADVRVPGAASLIPWRRQRAVVEAFLAASRGGDFDALLAVLDPDVVVRADRSAVQAGTSAEVRGAAEVAGTFAGRSRLAQPALVDGAVGAVWAPGGQPRVVFGFTITHGRIVAIDILADPERLDQLDLAVLDD